MLRILIALMLLTPSAFAQSPPVWNWASTQLGWFYRLQNDKSWTAYGVGRNQDGTFTLYKGQIAMATGPDLSTLEAQAITMASSP